MKVNLNLLNSGFILKTFTSSVLILKNFNHEDLGFFNLSPVFS